MLYLNRSHALSIFALALCMVLAACDASDPSGGGGGGGGADTAPPVAGSASASAATVTLNFNEAIDPTSVSADAFTITPGNTSVASATASGSTVTLTLASELPGSPNQTYSVAYSGVRDAAGNRANGSVSFDYGTDPPATTSLLIDFSRIEVINDCDGLLDGDGEFSFRVTATTGTGQSHTAYSGSRTMGDDDTYSSLSDVTFDLPATDGQQVTVSFRSTETDQDIFGTTFPDDRMNGLTATRSHRFNSGSWSSTGALTLTNGSGNCEVRLYYAALPQ
ncbi:MAG: Ig-like domain-containing protein [Rubricoccaceae bacterium]|nr:Ig-like domain-containing protein [Rubricoccaceae bacterium]